MAYTFNLNGNAQEKNIAAVRDEIDDVTDVAQPIKGKHYFLADERISSRITKAATELGADANAVELELWAAASCLDTLATNQAYVLKKQRTAGKELDGPAVAKEIRAHAESLRKRARTSLANRREEAAADASQIDSPCSGSVQLVPTY
jgi:hypothetical protein